MAWFNCSRKYALFDGWKVDLQLLILLCYGNIVNSYYPRKSEGICFHSPREREEVLVCVSVSVFVYVCDHDN